MKTFSLVPVALLKRSSLGLLKNWQDCCVFIGSVTVQPSAVVIEDKERTCDSLLMCIVTVLSHGLRSGGGVGDVLRKPSKEVRTQQNEGKKIPPPTKKIQSKWRCTKIFTLAQTPDLKQVQQKWMWCICCGLFPLICGSRIRRCSKNSRKLLRNSTRQMFKKIGLWLWI